MPFARSFVERRTQRSRSFSTSEFESSQAAVSHIATLILAAMIAVRAAHDGVPQPDPGDAGDRQRGRRIGGHGARAARALGAATTADRNAAPSIRPQSERRGIWNRFAASPATLKIATRLPASGEIDARAGGELVEARGLAIVLRKAATALFPKDPEIELSVSVALIGGEFVEPHEAL